MHTFKRCLKGIALGLIMVMIIFLICIAVTDIIGQSKHDSSIETVAEEGAIEALREFRHVAVDYIHYRYFVDDDTNVIYVMVHPAGQYYGGITPLYKADGSLMLYDEFIAKGDR